MNELEQHQLALRLMAEQLLLRDGATEQGVERHLDGVVQTYLDMATGDRPRFFGSKVQ